MVRTNPTSRSARRWSLLAAVVAVALAAGCIEGNPNPYSAEEDRGTQGPGEQVDGDADADVDEEENTDPDMETGPRDGGPEGSGDGPDAFAS